MPINNETLNRKLFRLLSRYKPQPLDSKGKVTPIEDEADVLKFTFTKDGESYGNVFATIDDNHSLTVYYGDDVTESPSEKTPGLDYDDTWTGLMQQLKYWAMKNQLSWKLQDRNHLENDMSRRDHMNKKDKVAESYYPMGKKGSYSDAIPTVKIVIEHSRAIEEGEQRYRNINRIFLENQAGERILAPTTKPGVARVYGRLIAEGDKPYSDRWNHITSIVEEYNQMGAFVRATRNNQFNESAQQLVNEGINHYQSLRETLSRMTGHRGYNAYFESWTPSLLEDEGDETNLNELFVQETLDPRIESVMPILSRLHKKVSESAVDKEVGALSEWADSLLSEEEGLTSNNPQGIPEEDISEAYTVVPGIDRERYQELPGLEGPFHTKSGRVVYYDKQEGKYYDPTTDMYIEYDDWQAMNEEDVEEGLTGAGIGAALGGALGSVVPGLGTAAGAALGGYAGHKIQQQGISDKKDVKEQGMAEGSNDTIYPNAEVIKSKNGKPVGEIYQDGDSWGAFHYRADRGYDFIDSREDAIEALKDLHQETSRSRPDYTIKGVAEGLDANQKRVGQVGPLEKAKNISPVLGSNPKKHPFNGKLVGGESAEDEEDSVAEGLLDAIKKIGKKVADKVAPSDEELLSKLEKETGGKRPNMYNKDDKEEVSESEERPYVCVHAKKGKCEVKASSSYQAAQKAAQKWGLKGTAGIDAHLADVEKDTSSLEESTDELARILTIMNHRR